MSGKSWWACVVVGAGLLMGASPRPGLGQGLYAPAPGADLERLSRRMAEAMRDLGDDINAGIGQTPQGQYLARDARELQRATGDWYAGLRGSSDPYQVRRSYSGLDISWHRLRGQLNAPGVMTQDMADEARRVDEVDVQIHRALNLNTYPPNFDGAPPPPNLPAQGPGFGPMDETRRLVFAAAQRAEAMAAACQAEYANDPDCAFKINDSANLARAVDGYYDALGNPQVAQQPDFARNGFVPIVRQANAIGMTVGGHSYPPGVRAAWEAYVAVHNQLRAILDLNNQTMDGLPPPNNINPGFGDNAVPGPVVVGIPFNPNPTGQVVGWADRLDHQVDDLLANFAPTARVVPEGGDMLEDMQRLRRAVIEFRRDAAQGFPPGRLAREFHEVDEHWQRLARRVDRVARGRTFGPNIERVQQIGQTCQQIHQVLGMPGYPPSFGPY